MPASRKPPRKGPVSPSSKSVPRAVKLPDRRAMESFMSAIGAPRAQSATDKAQDVMYQAWDQAEPRKRIALANKALTISPLCADAYVLLAEEKAKSAKEALEYYRKGVDAGSRALGTKAFNEYEGHFWGFLETRPYMRARAGLAATLDALGDVEAAIGHYRDMLRLNPGDNQGIGFSKVGSWRIPSVPGPIRNGSEGSIGPVRQPVGECPLFAQSGRPRQRHSHSKTPTIADGCELVLTRML